MHIFVHFLLMILCIFFTMPRNVFLFSSHAEKYSPDVITLSEISKLNVVELYQVHNLQVCDSNDAFLKPK